MNAKDYIELTRVVGKKKILYAWACKGNINLQSFKTKTVESEWPYKSGVIVEYPEIDNCGWFTYADAKWKIQLEQLKLLDELMAAIVIK